MNTIFVSFLLFFASVHCSFESSSSKSQEECKQKVDVFLESEPVQKWIKLLAEIENLQTQLQLKYPSVGKYEVPSLEYAQLKSKLEELRAARAELMAKNEGVKLSQEIEDLEYRIKFDSMLCQETPSEVHAELKSKQAARVVLILKTRITS